MHKKLLEVIVEESARLADIVNDLLLASQLDAERLEVHDRAAATHATTGRERGRGGADASSRGRDG